MPHLACCLQHEKVAEAVSKSYSASSAELEAERKARADAEAKAVELGKINTDLLEQCDTYEAALKTEVPRAALVHYRWAFTAPFDGSARSRSG